MARKAKISKKDIFYKMKADSENWTGYNANIVDIAVQEGINLEEENKDLQTRLRKSAKYNTEGFFEYLGKFCGATGGVLLAGIVLILGLILLTSITSDRKKDMALLEIAYQNEIQKVKDGIEKEKESAFKEGQYSKIKRNILNEFLETMTPSRVIEIIEEKEGVEND